MPFESLVAGDTVRIFWREGAYQEKIAINGHDNENGLFLGSGGDGP